MIVIDEADFRRFAGAMKELEAKENLALQKRIRNLAEPIAREVRAAALHIPVDPQDTRQRLGKKALERGERLGLRAGLAASVEVRTRSGKSNPGVRIVVSRSVFAKQTGKSARIPRAIEGLRRRRLRHPLFGNREHWYDITPKPFLLRTVLPRKGEVRDAILVEYMDTFKRVLAKHGIPVR